MQLFQRSDWKNFTCCTAWVISVTDTNIFWNRIIHFISIFEIYTDCSSKGSPKRKNAIDGERSILFASKYSVRWSIPWIPHDIIVNETMMSTMNRNRTLNCIFICVSNHFTIRACWRKMKMGTITTFHILNATIFESSISYIVYTTLFEFLFVNQRILEFHNGHLSIWIHSLTLRECHPLFVWSNRS